MDQFDFIIIGAGTAGCVLADRLSRDRNARVLILEAGGSDRRFWIRTPIGYGRTFADPAVNWRYQTLPSPGLSGRSMYWPRGRVLGGSSSINALVYCRGMPEDFDGWRDLGNAGWGWSDVKPYFERSERRVDSNGVARSEGPLDVKDVTPYLHPMRRNWLDAAAELGLPVTEDFNGEQPLGFGCYQVTIRHGLRRSAADAFLRPAMQRPGVELLTHAWASKIRIEAGRARGVEFMQGNASRYASADQILVCSGAVNSPQLLQLSGIGPAAHLAAHGVRPLLNSPAVGQHLQDHLAVVYSFKATQRTLNDELHSNLAKLRAGIRYAFGRRGPLALSVNQFGGFLKLRSDSVGADVQLYSNPVTYAAGDAARKSIEVDPFPGFYLCFQPTRPTSEGRIGIAGPDFRVAPDIEPNYMATEKDAEDAIQGGKMLQAIARTSAMRALIREPIAPALDGMSSQDLLADFRARAATVYHPVGTCRMGGTLEDSVVDSRLRVHGIEGLRVVDASVFPTVTSANTNAPTMMVAQMAADMILNDGKRKQP